MSRLESVAVDVILNAVEEDVSLMGVMELHEDLDEDDARAVLALVQAAQIEVTWP